MLDEIRTYWRSGDGDPYNGGRFGFDQARLVDGVLVATSTSRPADAVNITEAEHNDLVGSFLVEWDARAVGGKAAVDAARAEAAARRSAAAAKLVAGAALTEAEAASIAGGA